jgi:hypothetical protein
MMKRYFLSAFVLFYLSISAQYGRGDANHIGITLGANYTSLMTSQLETKPELSWLAGLSVRGNYYNNFSMVYGMHLTEQRFQVATINGFAQEDVNYKLMAAQVYLLLSYKIAGSFVTIDAGPVLQFNGNLQYNDRDADKRILGNELLKVSDLEKVSTFNALGHAGITAGAENIRFNVAYQYGFTNLLNNLNKQENISSLNTEKLKGNLGVVIAGIIFYF